MRALISPETMVQPIRELDHRRGVVRRISARKPRFLAGTQLDLLVPDRYETAVGATL